MARLVLDVNEAAGLRPGYALEAQSRTISASTSSWPTPCCVIRFEHPEVKAIAIESAKDRCSRRAPTSTCSARAATASRITLQVHQRDAAVPRGAQRRERRQRASRPSAGTQRRAAATSWPPRRATADRARGRRLERGQPPGGAGSRRPPRDRRAHAAGRQATGTPRPRGRLCDDGRGRSRAARSRVGARRRVADPQRVRRGSAAPALSDGRAQP